MDQKEEVKSASERWLSHNHTSMTTLNFMARKEFLLRRGYLAELKEGVVFSTGTLEEDSKLSM